MAAPVDGWQDRVLERSLRGAAAQSIERAASLMDATLELLERDGEEVTVQQIADRAGLSLRLLYRHFASKDALLAAVLEELLTRAADELRAELATVADPIERLVRFVFSTLDHVGSSLPVALARNAVLLSVTTPDEVRQAQAPMAALAAELVGEAATAGLLGTGPAEQGAYVLLELRRTYTHSRLLGNEFGIELPDPEDHVRFALRALGAAPESCDRAVRTVLAARG